MTEAEREADAIAAREALAEMCPDGVQLGDYRAHMAAMDAALLEREAEAGG